jgi:hypothetical protein
MQTRNSSLSSYEELGITVNYNAQDSDWTQMVQLTNSSRGPGQQVVTACAKFVSEVPIEPNPTGDYGPGGKIELARAGPPYRALGFRNGARMMAPSVIVHAVLNGKAQLAAMRRGRHRQTLSAPLVPFE